MNLYVYIGTIKYVPHQYTTSICPITQLSINNSVSIQKTSIKLSKRTTFRHDALVVNAFTTNSVVGVNVPYSRFAIQCSPRRSPFAVRQAIRRAIRCRFSMSPDAFHTFAASIAIRRVVLFPNVLYSRFAIQCSLRHSPFTIRHSPSHSPRLSLFNVPWRFSYIGVQQWCLKVDRKMTNVVWLHKCMHMKSFVLKINIVFTSKEICFSCLHVYLDIGI